MAGSLKAYPSNTVLDLKHGRAGLTNLSFELFILRDQLVDSREETLLISRILELSFISTIQFAVQLSDLRFKLLDLSLDFGFRSLHMNLFSFILFQIESDDLNSRVAEFACKRLNFLLEVGQTLIFNHLASLVILQLCL